MRQATEACTLLSHSLCSAWQVLRDITPPARQRKRKAWMSVWVLMHRPSVSVPQAPVKCLRVAVYSKEYRCELSLLVSQLAVC